MRKNNQKEKWLRKQYAIAGAFVVVAAVGMTSVYGYQKAKEREQIEYELALEAEEQELEQARLEAEQQEKEIALEEASSLIVPEQKTLQNPIAEIAEENGEAGAVIEEVAEEGDNPEENSVADGTDAMDDATVDAQALDAAEVLHFSADTGLLWPMEGNVILNYSMDSTVYFATLDQYKYNPAVLISGNVNDKVVAVAKGKISSIETDEVIGCTVTVDMGDGYQAKYGQLKEVNFEVGDYVEAGHVLGYLSEPTKYFSVEGSNLYFELQKDGVPQDPILFFE